MEYINGEITLILVKNPAFYFALLYSIVSPLLTIFTITWMIMHLGYTRDFRQGILWIVGFSNAIVWLVIRFYFPATYRYGCFVVFCILIYGYFYNDHYRPAIITTANLADYIYSMAKTPLLVLAQNGKVLLANSSALSFFEKPRAGLIETDIRDILDFGDKTLVFAKTASAGNRISRIGARALNSNTRCEIDISYIYDKYKEFYCAILFITDVTDKINLIDELEEAKRRADLANEAKSAFLANTSHEIRTPMNAIVGMSELILRENVSPKVYEYTLGIKQAGENLLSIINDILDFSKIESGKMEILPVNYHLGSLVNDVINIIRIRAMEKSLVFVTNIDSGLPDDLFGDEVRIRQVLLNLLGNAVKYTDRGYIKLSITMEGDENFTEPGGNPADGRFVLKMNVEDCGVGIKEENLDKVFGEFIQVDMTANRGIEGTGLGLPIAKRLCNAMGGDVTVRSVYGEGSVFTVWIPQKARSGKRFAAVENPGEKTVLICENRTTSADSLCWSLDNLGVSYTLTDSEEAFLEALRGERDRKKYGFVFVAQALYEKIRRRPEAGELGSRLVLLADYGSEAGIRDISFLNMPVHTLSVANTLNHKKETRNGGEKEKASVKFTAPSARVLIVDDMVTNLKVAQGLLLPYNLTTDICTSGAVSIELVKKNKYDLVFMDHMMPGMDGIETTAAIRAWEKERQGQKDFAPEARMPIIALTANAMSGMKEMFLRQGFDDYLAKPIEMLKLHGILEKWLPPGKRIRGKENAALKDPGRPSLFEGKNAGGIDLAEGMKRYGDDSMYLEILRSCAAAIPDFLNTLRGLSRETLDTYIITVHGIKGVNYQICADEAGREAKVLEWAAKAGDWETLEARNGAFIKTMETLLENLSRLLAELGEDPLDGKTSDRRSVMNEQKAKKIVLAVDDMPPNLAAIRTILCNDFDIRLAKSPLAALGMLNTVRVDLILLDVEMPEMSGFEFLEKLPGNAGRPPVIFITSHETPDLIARILSSGAAYMVKPIVPQVLLDKVNSALAAAEENNSMPR
ncbi:MAG: response regulator [Treponema sp.]|nr:response regulator [Treponema sp.]